MSHNIKQRMFLQRNMSENAGLPLDKCLDKTLESHDFTLSIIILYFVTEMSIWLARIKSKWVFVLGKERK